MDIAELLRELLSTAQADRILLWQLISDQLKVSFEVVAARPKCFIGSQLSVEESTAFVLQVFSGLPEESGEGATVLRLANFLPSKLPMLLSLYELGDVRSSLIAQLRKKDTLTGFLEMQRCGESPEWSYQSSKFLHEVVVKLDKII